MPYDVRTPDGQLSYQSLYDVERAYAQGLVSPDDEVSTDGGPWKKIKDVPALKSTRLASTERHSAWRARTVLQVILGVAALFFFFRRDYWMALGLGLVMAVFSMQQLTRQTRK